MPRQNEISPARRRVVMLAMALGAFAIGTTEFASMGLLPLIAGDFAISDESAATIISVYALGVVVGAPLIAATTGSLPRRRLIILLVGFLLAGNLLTALAPNYGALLAARFVAGLPHGAYFSVANLSAAALARPGAQGKAMAAVGMGLAVATVTGVPAAQALGQALGWHAAYLVVVAVAAATLVLLAGLFPHMTTMQTTSLLTELGALRNTQVVLTVVVGTVGFGGMFAVYTYITWTMTEVAGLDARWLWAVLMIYGVGMILGNAVGGVLADRNLELGIILALVCIAVTSVLFFAVAAHALAASASFGLLAFFGSTLVPSLQLRLMRVAGDAQTLAAALNQSALNIANAAGAAIGGAVVAAGFGYPATALAGAALAVAGCALWGVTQWDHRRLGGSRVRIVEQS